MALLRTLPLGTRALSRGYALKLERTIEFDKRVAEQISSLQTKARKHPGVVERACKRLPERVERAILERPLGNRSRRTVLQDCVEFENRLRCRRPPPERNEVDRKAAEIADGLERRRPLPDPAETPETVFDRLRNSRKGTVLKLLRRRVYHWQAIEYDEYACLKYLVCRSAAEYAVLRTIFDEIKKREPPFRPTSYFEFGSGVGSALWALLECWDTQSHEYFLVDTSTNMNELCRDTLLGAYGDRIKPERLFHRQFLPSKKRKYDVVVCAYSLFELPTAKSRLETVLSLWNKTGKYLVIVEHGTNAGYGLVCEARDFLLEVSRRSNDSHIFSPCAHEHACPRYTLDQTPCNFATTYVALNLISRAAVHRHELYSYVVLRRDRPNDEPRWPRIVRPILKRHEHAVCRMCCVDGSLKEVIFTRKHHGNIAYGCAKRSTWGDRFPITITETVVDDDDSCAPSVEPEDHTLTNENDPNPKLV